jgi:hypothetical protein
MKINPTTDLILPRKLAYCAAGYKSNADTKNEATAVGDRVPRRAPLGLANRLVCLPTGSKIRFRKPLANGTPSLEAVASRHALPRQSRDRERAFCSFTPRTDYARQNPVIQLHDNNQESQLSESDKPYLADLLQSSLSGGSRLRGRWLLAFANLPRWYVRSWVGRFWRRENFSWVRPSVVERGRF